MLLKKLTEEDKRSIMQKVKKRKIKELDEFICSFQPLIWKLYNQEIDKGYKLNCEDFNQQCGLIIVKCLKSFKGDLFGKLCNYVVKSLHNGVKDFMRKKANYERYNILSEDPDYVYSIQALGSESSLEETINKLNAVQSCKKLIKNRIPKRQEEVLMAFCLGEQAVKNYILKTGIKTESFRKCLNRAVISAIKLIKTDELHQFDGYEEGLI